MPILIIASYTEFCAWPLLFQKSGKKLNDQVYV